MTSRFLLAAALTLTLTPFLAQASDAQPGRYQLQPVAGGVVRLDTATGELTLCKADAGKLACDPAASEDAAGDLAALKARVDALERQLAGAGNSGMPSDAEVDRGLSIMEKFMRRFMGLAREMEQKNHDGDALPQKT
jgi:hypothetical protein